MTICSWRSLAGGLVACALFSPAQASARGFVLVTWGETIKHVGEATHEAEGVHQRIRVGFKYGYWGVFWLDLWTHGGTYCVYEGKQFSPIAPHEAARLLGKSESELGKPFLYRVPLGWLIFGPLIVLGIVVATLGKGSGDETGALFQDARYQKALDILNERYAKPPADAITAQAPAPPDPAEPQRRFQSAFDAGVQHLVVEGVPREQAEKNLAALMEMLDQMLAQAQQQQTAAPPGGPAVPPGTGGG
jgi:hypothetical protein